ncbi:hypothetical protein B0H13DRAFT_2067675 [Mycena leptocephala]|nr:hypothetical protein B0H13DRAFT_2067675 [Mycena leptocephala]
MHSPFKDILYTNVVPCDTDCDNIRDLVEGSRRELAHITEDIARLQLPEDVIRGIFMATLPSLRNSSLSSDEAPLLLCRICKSWRFVALSTPRLWASVHIVIPAPSRLKQLTDFVIAWVGRSGGVPIDVSMAFSRVADPRCDVSPLMSALVAVSTRWRHMQFVLRTYDHFASLSSNDVPQLQSMMLDNAKSYWGNRPTESLGFLATQSLRSIELPSSKSLLGSPISWGSLRHLKITRYRQEVLTQSGALVILRQCPLLETCDLAVSGAGTLDDTSQQKPFSLPYLTHMSVTNGPTPPEVPHFIGSIILPNLRSFYCYDDIRLPTSPLVDLYFRWTHPSNVSGSVLVAALADMPSLQELQVLREPSNLPDRSADPHFLTHLTTPPNRVTPVVCPRLRCLELEKFDALTGPLLQFIHAKRGEQLQTIVPLSRFSCVFERSQRRDIIPDLQDAIAAGLVLDLKYRPLPRVTYSPLEGIDRVDNAQDFTQISTS